ncbi:MAG: HAMP domain-containing histidine kinase [Clostridia bacterium]|nr:HAMP domain-containing histidine kinase [Clostridia bacterium]
MFKKSRRKIVAAIMSVLVLLWVGTLGVIYTSSYIEMSNRNERMLTAHADMFTLSQPFDNMLPVMPKPDGDGKRFDRNFTESPMFQLSTFYTVAMSYDGSVLETRNGQPYIHSDDELKELATEIIKDKKTKGTEKDLAFYKADKQGYNLVVFMDNTVINENAATLFRYTLIFGGMALLIFFFLSQFLAKKIIRPLEENHLKQKQFISDAGHELKTPVSVVNANAELLRREIGENQWLDNILYENERMGKLVGQLLDLARTESVTPKIEHIDFSRLTQGEALPFESVAFEKGLELICDIRNGITVEGNSSQLKQLVSILLDNGIRHSTDGCTVKLSLTKEHGSAILSVVNKGNEIPEEQRKQIFERFYRVDEARNGEDKHYGLGLAIAKAVTEAHKGNIEVLCYNSLVELRVTIPIKKA